MNTTNYPHIRVVLSLLVLAPIVAPPAIVASESFLNLVLPALESFCNLAFWQQFVVAMAAVWLGVFPALLVNRKIQSEGHKKEDKAKKAIAERRRLKLRSALRVALEMNKHQIEEMEPHWAEGRVPNFNVDLTVLESTGHVIYETLDDIELCVNLDYARRLLSFLFQLLNYRLAIHYSGNEGGFHQIRQEELTRRIRTLMPQVKKACQDAIDMLQEPE